MNHRNAAQEDLHLLILLSVFSLFFLLFIYLLMQFSYITSMIIRLVFWFCYSFFFFLLTPFKSAACFRLHLYLSKCWTADVVSGKHILIKALHATIGSWTINLLPFFLFSLQQLFWKIKEFWWFCYLCVLIMTGYQPIQWVSLPRMSLSR